jgi:hypothetical protein
MYDGKAVLVGLLGESCTMYLLSNFPYRENTCL